MGYKNAEENYAKINSIADTQLISEIKEEIKNLSQSVKPNTAEASVLKTLQDVLETYTLRNGLSVKQLIKTSDSLSGMANYELPFTGPKEILKRAASSLDEAAIRAIENNGGNANLVRLANKEYSKWAAKFANDEIVPFMERTVNNPESLFRQSTSNEGYFRAVERSLENAEHGKAVSDAMARRFAEKKMGKFKAEDVGTETYNKSLRDLRALIGEKRAAQFERLQRRQSILPEPQRLKEAKPIKGRVTSATQQKTPAPVPVKPRPIKQTAYPGNKLEVLAQKIAKYKKMKPEDVLKKLETRSGIKELRKEFGDRNVNNLVKRRVSLNQHLF